MSSILDGPQGCAVTVGPAVYVVSFSVGFRGVGVPLLVVTPLSKDSDGIRLMHKYFYYICLTTWEVRR